MPIIYVSNSDDFAQVVIKAKELQNQMEVIL